MTSPSEITTDDLRAALQECRDALLAYRDMAPSAKQRGHALGCNYGWWIHGHGPDDCSQRCQAEVSAIGHANRVLEVVTPRQEALL